MGFRHEEYERWISQAKRTLESAEADAKGGYHEWACFKAQQAAEYAVKSLTRALGISTIGHSVLKMLRVLEEALSVSIEQPVVEAAMELDRHYIAPRYPNAYDQGAPHEFYSRETADRIMSLARLVLDYVTKLSRRWVS